MSNTAEQRKALIAAYPPVSSSKSNGWTKRVNAMSDEQVHAIYLRLKKQGKIN